MESMPKAKKKKLSKKERKELMSEKGKKSGKARGTGTLSRQNFTTPAQWETNIRTGDTRELVDYYSPGKTKYRTQKAVEEQLRSRNMELCFDEAEGTSQQVSEDDSDEYCPSDECVKVEQRLFVCESTQVTKFVDEINKTSRCSTKECDGILVVTKVEPTGLGGTLNLTFTCSGCQGRTVNFNGSTLVEGSKRTVVGLALAVAFFISGHGYAKFSQTLRQCLGISSVSKNRYYEVVKMIYPHITDILNEMCEEEKERMKEVLVEEMGSWEKAVVTSDGVWQTRGFFSKNGSFIVKNYLTGGLLWYGHKCMRGNDDVVEDDLYEGTAKSMEGVLAEECYKEAKEEGCNIEVVWQDADSSAALSLQMHHPDAKIYKCGGHVGRAHYNQLKEAAKKKVFSADIKRIYSSKFPAVLTAKCKCERHKSGCGCLGSEFLKNARINHFCCLQQCTNAAEYARRMRALGKYHTRDIHEWGDGETCGFHDNVVCSCKSCDENKDMKCPGKPYKTKTTLTCEYHWLAYQIECERRACDADSIIHPTMGRGHSNLCEAHFSVLPAFRSKHQSLCRLHYMTSTNCGLCQGNMSWCFKVRGQSYHWILDLYERLKLPTIPAIVEALQKQVVQRMKEIEKGKTEKTKKNRVHMKVARAEDQIERKKWLKRQALQHSYGNDDVSDSELDHNLIKEAKEAIECVEGSDGALLMISGKSCRCGSKEHKRTSHSTCPLNSKNKRNDLE